MSDSDMSFLKYGNLTDRQELESDPRTICVREETFNELMTSGQTPKAPRKGSKQVLLTILNVQPERFVTHRGSNIACRTPPPALPMGATVAKLVGETPPG